MRCHPWQGKYSTYVDAFHIYLDVEFCVDKTVPILI